MQTVTTIGFDIAKSVFQVHGVDAVGQVVIRRQLKRRHVLAFFEKLPPCLVGIEACASSHHWSRELQALGHTVRLMPPAYVKPYVKRQKNDMADAEAICEAVIRANMRASTMTRWQFYAFDILVSNGEDVRKLSFSMRKTDLSRLLARRVDGIFLSDFEQGEIGPDLFRHACLMGLEGLVSKLPENTYRAGRFDRWIKVKHRAHPAFAPVRDQF
jgi:hypothetical protein